ncbi:MAG TPA: ACP synthase [Polyangia bacterium]|nr:ACP synthase [Polyangia bacterium]
MTGEAIREKHAGELALRRLRAGEPFSADETAHFDVAAHAETCAECRGRLKALDDEQRRFEQDISLDRFSAGVARAARAPSRARANKTFERNVLRLMVPTLAVAAAVAIFVGPVGQRQRRNNIKGGDTGIIVRVAAGDGPQRTSSELAPEALSPGERLRIGYKAGDHRYLLSLSIDQRGEVTPLYPESGQSVPVGKAVGSGPRYLPDSVEFTDAGPERLFVILSDTPIDVEAARRAARASFDQARGDVLHMPALALPGEQFQRTFIKP